MARGKSNFIQSPTVDGMRGAARQSEQFYTDVRCLTGAYCPRPRRQRKALGPSPALLVP
jgi:hypothetical protein